MARKSIKPIKVSRAIKETIQNFLSDDGPTLAAALSFYAILSLIPLMMIVVSILGHFLGQSEAAMNSIIRLISEGVPQLTPSFLKNFSSLIQRKMTGGWAGVVVLFFVASLLFSNLEKVLDKIFQSAHKRNFFHSKLLSVLFIFMISVLLFVPSILKNIDFLFFFFKIPVEIEKITQENTFFFLLGWASFVMVLAMVPKKQVNIKLNCLGGLCFGALLIGVKLIFRWYTAFSLERFHLVYGSLTALILVFLWIFYLMNLFIFSAEFVGVLQRYYHPED